jgi:cellulose synthase/poly-beta-1,6-N-acetylglucosamine synthase-like glycosyltransferase
MSLNNTMQQKNTISMSVLIPAHNEERAIAACIDSCLAQTRPADQIVVVNDGSTDNTGSIIAQYGDKITVVTIPKATGNKSYAQEIGLNYVTSDIFVATDGDTILDENFLKVVERHFIEQPELGAVSGYVQGSSQNWLTALREIDYVVGQDLYKQAQACMNYILVIPGCAGAFKTSLFKDGTVRFEHDTLTEDLDFTYRIHEHNIKIAFATDAISHTQDPYTIQAYVTQMRRWYGGGWQNLLKHYSLALKEPRAALQLSLTYIESFAFVAFFFILPLVNFFVFMWLMVAYLLIMVTLGAYAAIRRKNISLLYYSPLGLVLRFLNVWIFIEQFVIEVILGRRNMVWFSPERRIVVTNSISSPNNF